MELANTSDIFSGSFLLLKIPGWTTITLNLRGLFKMIFPIALMKIALHKLMTLSTDVVVKLAENRMVAGALLHSDQGIHYTNKIYQGLLKENGIILSMSRKGNCWDNAIMENFFSHLKCECVRVRKRSLWSFLDVVEAVEEYISYYNHERTQKKLYDLSPIDFRQQLA